VARFLLGGFVARKSHLSTASKSKTVCRAQRKTGIGRGTGFACERRVKSQDGMRNGAQQKPVRSGEKRCRQRKAKNMNETELRAELERVRAENAKLKAAKVHKPTLKVSEKGGVSIYGLGRFPVTLYRAQWERLLGMSEDIRAFIAENESRLKVKPEVTTTPTEE